MKSEQMICKTGTAFGQSEEIGVYALASAVNQLVAEGGRIFHINVQTFFPLSGKKSHVYAIEKKLKGACKEQGIILVELSRSETAAVSQYMVVVTGTAAVSKMPQADGGQEIVLVNSIGLEGTLRILAEKERELAKRFAPVFLEQIRNCMPDIWALKAVETAMNTKDCSISCVRQVGEGGIFASLYCLAEEMGTGLETDVKKMSIRQETIEICEYFHLNPYQLASAGTMLMVTGDGETLVRELTAAGIEAAVIGRFRDDKDKIIRNGEEMRYIDRPVADEINRV